MSVNAHEHEVLLHKLQQDNQLLAEVRCGGGRRQEGGRKLIGGIAARGTRRKRGGEPQSTRRNSTPSWQRKTVFSTNCGMAGSFSPPPSPWFGSAEVQAQEVYRAYFCRMVAEGNWRT